MWQRFNSLFEVLNNVFTKLPFNRFLSCRNPPVPLVKNRNEEKSIFRYINRDNFITFFQAEV